MTSRLSSTLGAFLGVIFLSVTAAPESFGQTIAKGTVRSTRPTAQAPVITYATGSTTSAVTVPVGFTQTVITPATNATTPSSQVLSVPFYAAAAYAAAVTTVDSATAFSSTSAAWTPNQFSQSASPYLVHFQSGNSVGRYFLIASNTATQITVYPRGYALNSVVAAADTFEIVPANTLGSLFGTSSVPFQTGSSAASADDVYLWNGTNFAVYYNNGNNWAASGSLTNQNPTVVYPDEGIFLVRRGLAALTLTFVGTVPATSESSDILGPSSTFVSNRFPVATTLVNVGFQNLPNWLDGSSASQADNVYLWNGTAWNVYYYNGTNWKVAGNLGTVDSQPIAIGTAMFVVRQSSATVANASLVQTLPYSVN